MYGRGHVRTRISIGWVAPVAAVVVVAALLASSRVAGPKVVAGPAGPSASLAASVGSASIATSPSYGTPTSTPSELAPSASPAEAGGLKIATSDPGFSGGDALDGGTLRVERRGSSLCFYATSGAPGPKTALVWPYGFSAGSDGHSILGPDRQELARVRDLVTLGGGAPPPGYRPTASQDPCGYGAIFWVSSVATVNGSPVHVGEGSLVLTTRPRGQPNPCPTDAIEPVMLVMVDDHLKLRVLSSGVDVEASWPAGYFTRTDPIRIVSPDGRRIAIQGRETGDLHGAVGPTGILVCP